MASAPLLSPSRYPFLSFVEVQEHAWPNALVAANCCHSLIFRIDLGPCEVEVEFVPEPGTLLLLGSGLMGLGGYATSRWRIRE